MKLGFRNKVYITVGTILVLSLLTSNIFSYISSKNMAKKQINNTLEVLALSNIKAMDTFLSFKHDVLIDFVKDLKSPENTITSYMNSAQQLAQIVKELTNIDELSSTNSRSVEEISSASEHSTQLIEELNSELKKYNT